MKPTPQPERAPAAQTPSGNYTFAYCIIFLRNAGERLRAIKLTMDEYGISLPVAREWVDSVQLIRDRIDMTPARKTLEEYPCDMRDIQDQVECRISHWPAPLTAAQSRIAEQAKEIAQLKAQFQTDGNRIEYIQMQLTQSKAENEKFEARNMALEKERDEWKGESLVRDGELSAVDETVAFLRQQLAQSEQRATAAEKGAQKQSDEAVRLVIEHWRNRTLKVIDERDAALARATVAEGRVRELEKALSHLIRQCKSDGWHEGHLKFARAALHHAPGDRQDVPAREGEG